MRARLPHGRLLDQSTQSIPPWVSIRFNDEERYRFPLATGTIPSQMSGLHFTSNTNQSRLEGCQKETRQENDGC